MKVTPVAGSLGAELSGVDLVSMDDDAKKSLREAIVEHEVVFIRDAFLDEEQHLELGRVLGEPNVFPLFALLGATEPTMTVIEDGPDSPPEADYWHTDVTWVAEPPDFALLQANVVPERGGDTLWASMTAAFEALSEPMKDLCRGLSVCHSNDSFIAGMERKSPEMVAEHDLGRRLRDAYPPVDHPLIRTHPESGREVLFLGGRFMQRVNELTETESAAPLNLLGRHVEDARFHCRWRWKPGDLAIWDERSTNHRSAADHFPQHRQFRRCEVGGARPTRH
ncbi:MAG: TauD/TfdA family dioxygenase [bacterium]|nr:TauD/TfdA family dioxygenase [bacterium]